MSPPTPAGAPRRGFAVLTGMGVPAVRDGAQAPTWGFLEVGRAVPECSVAQSQPLWVLWVAWAPRGEACPTCPASAARCFVRPWPRREGAATWLGSLQSCSGTRPLPEAAAPWLRTGHVTLGAEGHLPGLLHTCCLHGRSRCAKRALQGVNASSARRAPHLFHENWLCAQQPPSGLALTSHTFTSRSKSRS